MYKSNGFVTFSELYTGTLSVHAAQRPPTHTHITTTQCHTVHERDYRSYTTHNWHSYSGAGGVKASQLNKTTFNSIDLLSAGTTH